jgi:serine/threonine-protein kinase
VVDGRADVYALGVVAWECVSGRPPFEGDARQVVAQHLGGRVPPPSRAVEGVPEPFDAAVAQATDPDPGRRFLRASDFAAAIGAPRRRRVDETLRATTRVPTGPDTTAAWAPAAEGATEGWTQALGGVTPAPPAQTPAPAPGQGPGGTVTTQVPRAPVPPTQVPPAGAPPAHLPPGRVPPSRSGAPQGPLRPRPTTGRVPKARAARSRDGKTKGRVLAVLVVVGLLAVGLATRAGGLLGGSVRVPEVVGLSVAEATRDLRDRGLAVRVGEPVASDHVHQGLVATQSVAGGERARRRDTVVVRPSLGIILPDLVKRPAGAATGRLDELDIGFRREERPSMTVAKGNVAATRPAKGTVLKAGQVVTVVISTGRPPVDVPEVTGRSVEEAQGILGAAHLRARPERVFDDNVPKDLAVGTEPGGGSRVAWGSTVVLRISKGPDLVEVPQVVGLSKREAAQRLRKAGLKARFLFPVGSRVVEQSPAAGEQAIRGSEVRLLLNLF